MDTPAPTINVDISRPIEDFEHRVVAAAAHAVLSYYSYDEDGEPHRVPTELERKLRESVEAAIRDRGHELADQIVATILDEGVQPTDTYGAPRGPKVSVIQAIANEVRKELVYNHNGSRSRHETALEKALHATVRGQLAGELNHAVEEAKAQVFGSVRENAAQVLADIVKKSQVSL